MKVLLADFDTPNLNKQNATATMIETECHLLLTWICFGAVSPLQFHEGSIAAPITVLMPHKRIIVRPVRRFGSATPDRTPSVHYG